MAETFSASDVEQVVGGRHVVFMGDSIIRGVYKVGLYFVGISPLENQDFIWASNCEAFIPLELLKINKTSMN